MRTVIFAVLLTCGYTAIAQNNIVHFSIWNPKAGQSELFEEGYHHHLQWHTANKDSWSWYGWYFISGPRYGQFVDATFGHSWSDFDHPVNPGGDRTDNALHTAPFADFLRAFKAVRLPFSDLEDSAVLTAKFMRILTIDIIDRAAAIPLIVRLLADYRQKGRLGKSLVYELVDGGESGQIIVLLDAANFEYLGKSAAFAGDLLDIDHGRAGGKSIGAIMAETLRFRPDMSVLR
jgi:hypothetical protein